MTEAKRTQGAEQGKRFYDRFARKEWERNSGQGLDLTGLGELAAGKGVTHEEALLLLAQPDDIESIIAQRLGAASSDEASLQRLLSWSDGQRRLRVTSRADSVARACAGLQRGAQGIGLLRGEELLRDESLLAVYEAWLSCTEDEEERKLKRGRLVYLWTESWIRLLQAADGKPCSVSLAWDARQAAAPEERLALQDVQLEAMFRAMLRCDQEEIPFELALLALWPMQEEEWLAVYDFIEEVGRQTLGAWWPEAHCKVGALLHPDVRPVDAAGIARSADLVVMDIESASRFHLLQEQQPLGGPARMIELEEPVSDWGGPALQCSRLEEIVDIMRSIKPELDIRAGGDIRPADLRAVYRLGMNEVCCEPEWLTAVRLTGYRLEASQQSAASADEG
ncbi:hypothetical protein JJQ72_16415 [Paenibacillus sp. F411]|uniref:hypothetical protein n=1 Tax=Paenibacillus sp. F411 TaxID=2820239 RepID=UPI001AAE84B7|nr:hypothetical protein [Paenibacillus sp. F411]MBO2945563.1 hypothetical protein [Paenibacillus sp. F411]